MKKNKSVFALGGEDGAKSGFLRQLIDKFRK
jgi:hypothetical protein